MLAQQNFVASGVEAKGIGGSSSCSVGQIDYITLKDSLIGTIAQGLQQPYDILNLTTVETGINISIYPNPTKDFILLNVQDASTQNMTYILYDVLGKVIESKELSGNQTSISMVSLANDIYFIKVLENNTELKFFKIIKNK